MNNLQRLKFRAWLKNEKVMTEQIEQITNNQYVSYIKFPRIKNWLQNELNNATWACLSDVVLMQCIGLKDANQKLIFEGDILTALQRKQGDDEKKKS